MADPLSIVSSVTGILSFGITVTQGLFEYYKVFPREASNANPTVQKLSRLISSIENLSLQLNQLERQSIHIEDFSYISSCLETCRRLFGDLDDELSKLKQIPDGDTIAGGHDATDERISYAFRQSTLQKLDKKIDNIISNMSTLTSLLLHDDRLKEQDKLRYERTGATGLEEAIDMARRAVMEMPEDHADRASRSINLANLLMSRYESTGSLADLNGAIYIMQQSIEVTSDGHPKLADCLSNLGLSFGARYDRTGLLEDLEKALQVTQQAISATPTSHRKLADYLSSLGILLASRFQSLGSLVDLEKAIQATEQAISATPSDHPKHTDYLSRLGTFLGIRFQSSGSLVDLDRAIQVTQQAISATPTSHRKLADYLSSLGILLASRFQSSGSLADLDRAIPAAREAYEATPKDHPHSSRRSMNLATMLTSRFKTTADLNNLEEAIVITERTSVDMAYEQQDVTLGKLQSLLEESRQNQRTPEIDIGLKHRHDEDSEHRERSDSFHNVNSKSSVENDSIFSLPDSIISTTTSASTSGLDAIYTIFVSELTDLFRRDVALMPVLSAALEKENIGFDRMRSNFRKLVKHCAKDLKVEAPSNHHQKLAEFVSSHAKRITMELFSTQTLRSHQDREEDQRRAEEYLSGLGHFTVSELDPTPDSDEDSDTGFTEDEVDEESYHHLQTMKGFILKSAAYETLNRRLNEFVYPTFQSKLRDLATAWSKPNHKHNAYVTRYKLLNLVAELRYIDPSIIQVHDFEEAEGSWRSSVGSYQDSIEKWTGVRWDWWPLLRCPRPLEESESRVRWNCTCGESRWAEVPSPFAKRLGSILNSLPSTIAHGSGTNLTSNVQDPSPIAGQDGRIPIPPLGGGRENQQTGGSLLGNAVQPGSSQPNDATDQSAVNNYRVLFLVKQGTDYKLAQIRAGGLDCPPFFIKLREEYFNLRGFFRGWLSVWRYSHCDFYMCEKFDDHEFSPRKKDNFPHDKNTDYDYLPKPMDNIPPISEHEFGKRFYSCHQPQPIVHRFHKCKQLGAHSHDLLKLFPKKKTTFEEGGDKRESFWGIYAREAVSFGWVLFYNLVCILPMLIFLIAWAAPSGRSTDLQNPSVPFSMMVSMLSLFWSLFLSSLQFGESH